MFVCGYNKYYQLGEESNNKNTQGNPIICPPKKSHFIMSSLLSISSCNLHTVIITQRFEAFAFGYNDCSISLKLPREIIKEKEIIIKDENGKPFKFISAVCGHYYTLYLVKNETDLEESRLIFASLDNPLIIVNMHGRTAVSLFGGYSAAVVIDKEGSIIFLEKGTLSKEDQDVEPQTLPNGEMPIDVAIIREHVFVVGSLGNLYHFRISNGKLGSCFKVTELIGETIVSVTGSFHHCFAITDEGKVFGFGRNNKCKLGFPNNITSIDKFKEIESLKEYEIVSAFAGADHSIFKTSTGKVLGCGNNSSGQLFLEMPSDLIYPPIELPSCYNNHFFIAGEIFSIAINEKDVPPNTPNRRIGIPNRPKFITKNVKTPSSTTKEKDIHMKKTTDHEIIKLKEEFAAKEKSYKLQISELEKKLKEATQDTTEKDDKKESLNTQFDILDEEKLEALHRIKRIGRGSTSEVFEVSRETHLAQKFFIFDDGEIDMENMKRLFNEYQILSTLKSPYIVKTFGMSFGTETEPPSILLELCTCNLKQKLKSLNDEERCGVISELSQGMRDVHQAGLIHCDLKLENILLDDENHMKLSDFGHSTLIKSDTMSNRSQIAGTLKYMAPELILERTDYNEKVDVYAFGVLIYVIVTKGEFPNISLVDVGNGKKAEIPSSITEFSRELINNCWSFNSTDRPSFGKICEILEGNENKLI